MSQTQYSRVVDFATGSVGPVIRLHDVAAGKGGFRIDAEAAIDLVGNRDSGGTDINGDGIDDIVIGAFGNDSGGDGAGAAYVVFGKTGSDRSNVSLTEIAKGHDGFKIQGRSPGDYAGYDVAAAGDVNGDHIGDLLITAPGQHRDVYLVYGPASSALATVDLDDVSKGKGGFRIEGERAVEAVGSTVAAAGDVNGDGLADFLIGTPYNDSAAYAAGACYVVFGTTKSTASPLHLADIAHGKGGFKIEGQARGDYVGHGVSSAGDFNGDGLADVLIGGRGDNAGAYVVFGVRDLPHSPVELDDVAKGQGGLKVESSDESDWLGISVSSAGDVNGDGFDDVLVGAPFDNGVAGAAYVIFGTSMPLQGTIDTRDIGHGVAGFKLTGEGDGLAGRSVSGAGDFNGDGFDDLLIGAFDDSTSAYGAGAAYIVYGKATGFSSVIDLAIVAKGIGGIKIVGEAAEDAAGFNVSRAGDLNHDGFDDVLIGAFRHGEGGASYVVFGRPDGREILGDNGPNLLNGTSGPDVIKGLGGDDRLYGLNGADQLDGGKGYDRLFGGAGADKLLGGDGSDRLFGDGGNDTLTGGKGRDLLQGGTGADHFVFDDGDSGLGTNRNDEIGDFSHAQGDRIDLSRIDADLTHAGDQTFTWIGTTAFTKTGQLHYVQHGQDIFLEGNNDADKAADFSIELNHVSTIAKADLIL
ncbi:MAG: hypothetical protein U1E45_19335 [Geminicoccaceae bacterium]